MRAHTFYEPYEFQAGSPPRIVTIPHAPDLANPVQDVQLAKGRADLVFVSLHWGVHFVPKPCDYQPVVAHAAIAAGASGVLGHHPHLPQTIEIYKGAPIFYSIGNFSFWLNPVRKKGHHYCAPNQQYIQDDVYRIEPDPGFVFEYKRHFNEGGIAFIDADRSGVQRVTYMPTVMNEAGQPLVVRPGEPQFEKSLTYLNWSGKFVKGGATEIRAAGDCYEIYTRAN